MKTPRFARGPAMNPESVPKIEIVWSEVLTRDVAKINANAIANGLGNETAINEMVIMTTNGTRNASNAPIVGGMEVEVKTVGTVVVTMLCEMEVPKAVLAMRTKHPALTSLSPI